MSRISLPSGPGSIEGLGESFEPQLNTGTYSMGLPLKLPQVRGSVQPEVRFAYNSGSGNGPLGLGWRLDIPAIQRQTDKGLPQYNTNDTFVTFAGEELVALADGTYRAENEGAFTRWEDLGTNGWRATRRDGSVLRYGQTAQARQDHPTLGAFRWMLESSHDLNGNRIEYSYSRDAGEIYLSDLRYGLHATLPSSFYHLKFDYDTNRLDCLADYRGRFRAETRWRLRSATLEFEGRRVRHWKFDYKPENHLSVLAAFRQFGDERSSIGTDAILNRDFLPAVTFDYSTGTLGERRQWADVLPFQNVRLTSREADLIDINRDGLPDILLYENGKYVSYLNRGPGLSFASPQEFTSAAFYPPLNEPGTKVADLSGDGTLKVLIEDGGGYYYRDFTSGSTLGPPVDYLVPGNFPLGDPGVQLIDIDNDRALDFVAADTGDSTFAMLLSRAGKGSANIIKSRPTPLAQAATFAGGWQFADLNGDRMPDLAAIGTLQEGGTVFYPGKGFGEFDALQRIGNGPQGPADSDRADGGLLLVDLDGDGLADLVSIRSGIVKVWANRSGKEWSPPVVVTDAEVPAWNGESTSVRFADVNGNGSIDIVWNDPDGGIFLRYLDLNPASKPNIMTRMENGMGRSLEIEYKTSTGYMLEAARAGTPWTMVPPFPIPVVSSFTERDGLGSTYRTEITYSNGYFDGAEREFRGFETAIRSEIGNDSQGAPTLLTEYLFDTGATTEALKGKPLRVTRQSVDKVMFDQVESSWKARELPLPTAASEFRKVTYAFQENEQTTITEQGRGSPVTLFREFSWDDYGNQTRLADYGRVEGANRAAWDDERITERTYSAQYPGALTSWILGLPVTEAIKDETGALITATESFYDDETFSASNTGTIIRGNLTLQRRLVNPESGEKIDTSRNRYDGYGNIREIYDPLGVPSDFSKGHVREISYDNSLHTHPIAETIHINSNTPPLVATADYNFTLGVMAASSDFNTNHSFYDYDTFGRIAAITRPLDTTNAPTELYEYELARPLPGNKLINSITARKRETSGGGTLDSRLFFDGLGRKVMVRAEGENPDQTVVTDTVVYNDRRAVWKKYLPYFDGGGLDWKDPAFNSGFVESHYDSLGRVVRAYQPDVDGQRVFAETTYEPLARLTRDEEQTRPNSAHYGSAMRHIEDGLRNNDGVGRLREVHEIVKITGSGAPAADPETWVTRYQYDLLDQLTRITDSQENVKIMRYDGLARLVFMDDPDRGEMHYLYDDASNLKQTIDNKKQVIQYTYDGANRILTENYLDGLPKPGWRLTTPNYAVSTNYSVLYHYDAAHPDFPGLNVRGQLAFVQDLSGEEHLSYDARSRIFSQTKRIPDPILSSLYPITNIVTRTGPISTNVFDASVGFLVPYITSYTYDSLDRLVELTYPDGDMVTNLYNSRGLLTRITGGPTGSIIGNITYQASAQLQRIRYGNSVITTYDYDPRLRLKHLQTRGPRPLAPLEGPGFASANVSSRDQDSGGVVNALDQGEGEALIDFTYHFDAASNIRRIDDNRDLPKDADYFRRQNTQIYDYDSLYRLTAAEYPVMLSGSPGRIDYRYDRIGNMTSQTSNISDIAEDGTRTVDLGTMKSGGALGATKRLGKVSEIGPHALSEISNSKSQVPVRNYAYDQNGNTTKIDHVECGWDFHDRMSHASSANLRANFVYDYGGNRTVRTHESGVEESSGRLLQEALFVNKHYAVRHSDTPIKYVWYQNTRVARSSTWLSYGPRNQFIRLHPGWNHIIFKFGSTSSFPAGSSPSPVKELLYWVNNSESGEFLPYDSQTQKTRTPEIVWLRSSAPAILRLVGTPATPDHDSRRSYGGHSYSLNNDRLDLISKWLSSNIITSFRAANQAWIDDFSPGAAKGTEARAEELVNHPVIMRSVKTNPFQNLHLDSDVRYYHTDHLGSVSAITDSSAALIQESASYSFGTPRFQLNPPLNSEYAFAHKEVEEHVALLSFEARYLSLRLPRFISVDNFYARNISSIISVPQRLNLYAYALNRPLTHVDELGLSEQPNKPGFFAAWKTLFSNLVGLFKANVEAVKNPTQPLKPIDEAKKTETAAKPGVTLPDDVSIEGGAAGMSNEGISVSQGAAGLSVSQKGVRLEFTPGAGFGAAQVKGGAYVNFQPGKPGSGKFGTLSRGLTGSVGGSATSDLVPGGSTSVTKSKDVPIGSAEVNIGMGGAEGLAEAERRRKMAEDFVNATD